MESPTVVFSAPGVVEVVDRPVGKPARGQVLLRTRRTLISGGTELTVLSGDFRPGSAWAALATFPFRAGYCAAGEIVEVGPDTAGADVGDLVAAPTPHARLAVVDAARVTRVAAERIAIDSVPFATLGAIVMNAVRRAGVGWGDSVVVVGVGLLGQLAVRFARLCGARPVIAVDPRVRRLALLPADASVIRVEGGVAAAREAVASSTRGRLADVVFEVTGIPRLIADEFSLLRERQGRFVVLSSPRGEPEPFDFHDLCNWPSHTIVGTHTSSHPPVETPDTPWTASRNTELFFDLLRDGEIDLDALVTHRFAFRDAPEAYRVLLDDPSEALGVVLDWGA